MMSISAVEHSKLRTAARKAAGKSYARYSNYPVGAAVLTGKRRILSGCNVENASYGLANCAERTAIFKAVSEGERSIRAVYIYVPADDPATPCGACRQVIREFGPRARVVSFSPVKELPGMSLDELLPHSFGPRALDRRARSAGRRKKR